MPSPAQNHPAKKRPLTHSPAKKSAEPGSNLNITTQKSIAQNDHITEYPSSGHFSPEDPTPEQTSPKDPSPEQPRREEEFQDVNKPEQPSTVNAIVEQPSPKETFPAETSSTVRAAGAKFSLGETGGKNSADGKALQHV
jgi:hypothetical protein